MGFTNGPVILPLYVVAPLFSLERLTCKSNVFLTLEDIPIVVKTVLSTANINKVGLVRLFIANNGKLTAKEIEKSLNVFRPNMNDDRIMQKNLLQVYS